MKASPRKSLNKPRFAVDINVSFSILGQTFGGFAMFVSTAKLTKNQSALDEDIIQICNKKNYHIITHNTKDFIDAPLRFKDLKIGIICINLDEKHYLSKFGSVLRKFPKHDNYYNKIFQIGNEVGSKSYTRIRSEDSKRSPRWID